MGSLWEEQCPNVGGLKGEIKELYPNSQCQLPVPAQHGPQSGSLRFQGHGVGVSGMRPSVYGVGQQHRSGDIPGREMQVRSPETCRWCVAVAPLLPHSSVWQCCSWVPCRLLGRASPQRPFCLQWPELLGREPCDVARPRGEVEAFLSQGSPQPALVGRSR